MKNIALVLVLLSVACEERHVAPCSLPERLASEMYSGELWCRDYGDSIRNCFTSSTECLDTEAVEQCIAMDTAWTFSSVTRHHDCKGDDQFELDHHVFRRYDECLRGRRQVNDNSRLASDCRAVSPRIPTRRVVRSQPPEAPEDTSHSWEYQDTTDDMGRRTILACIKSDNAVRFSFPYAHPDNRATFCVRQRTGKLAAFLYVEAGQMMSNSWDGIRVNVKFGDSGITPVRAFPPESQDSTMTFIRRERWLVTNAKQHTDFNIEVPFYQAGRKVFSFRADEPLEWSR